MILNHVNPFSLFLFTNFNEGLPLLNLLDQKPIESIQGQQEV